MAHFQIIATIVALLLVSSFGQAGVTYKFCDRSQEAKLESAMKTVPGTLASLRSEIKKRYGSQAGLDAKNLSGEKASVKNADTMLACTQRAAKTDYVFECHAKLDGDAYAWTLPVVGKVIKYDFAALDLPEKELAAIVIHEITHKCGANDADYFHYRVPESTRFFDWSSIADTYRYFANNGFCVPGKDCVFSW